MKIVCAATFLLHTFRIERRRSKRRAKCHRLLISYFSNVGTAMATFDRLSTFVMTSGCDDTGLGRWAWQLVGKGSTRTRVVVAYQPGKPGPNSKGYTVWEQHQRYFEAKGDFRSDLPAAAVEGSR